MLQRIVLGLAGVLLAMAPVSVRAQAMPAATARVADVSAGVTYSMFQPDYGSASLNGITGYLDIGVGRHWGVEAETHRMIYGTGNNMSEISYLLGPRYTFGGEHFRVYTKEMIGGAAFNYPTGVNQPQGKFFIFAFGGGLDIPMGSRFTLRAADFEYQIWPGFAVSSLSPYGVSFGGSYRFWKARH